MKLIILLLASYLEQQKWLITRWTWTLNMKSSWFHVFCLILSLLSRYSIFGPVHAYCGCRHIEHCPPPPKKQVVSQFSCFWRQGAKNRGNWPKIHVNTEDISKTMMRLTGKGEEGSIYCFFNNLPLSAQSHFSHDHFLKLFPRQKFNYLFNKIINLTK